MVGCEILGIRNLNRLHIAYCHAPRRRQRHRAVGIHCMDAIAVVSGRNVPVGIHKPGDRAEEVSPAIEPVTSRSILRYLLRCSPCQFRVIAIQ